MIDPEMDFVVRRRIPPILAANPSQRAADGLFEALADPRFEVRYAAGRALMRMLETRPNLTLPREAIIATIMAEIAREQTYVDKLGDDELEGDALAPLDVVTRDRVTRGLEHLFNELAILLGSEAVRICFRALHQEDERARGTALEYLQTVLPSELRDALWPLLGEDLAVRSVRPAAEVLSDLTRAMSADSAQKTAKPRPAPPS
jgi:HEAT repeat protein